MTNHDDTTTAPKIHPFEKAGLGLAPFRFIAVESRVGPIVISTSGGVEMTCGAPGQPMGTCDYCGTGIATCCVIKSADGREFIVGSDCVAKTGQDALISEVDRAVRKMTKATEAGRIEELTARLDSDAALIALLVATPHPTAFRAEQGANLGDWIVWMLAHSGHAGKLRALRVVAKLEKAAARREGGAR